MSKPENPSAFPFQCVNPDGEPHSPEYGMTLRDWFAGQALVSLLQVKDDLSPGESAYAGCTALAADDAYRFADAMLAQRLRVPEPPEQGGGLDHE